MKTGSLLLALFIAGSTLGAQEQATIPAQRADSAHVTPSKALDSAASFANQVTTGELHQGAEPAEAGEEHVAGCEHFAPGGKWGETDSLSALSRQCAGENFKRRPRHHLNR